MADCRGDHWSPARCKYLSVILRFTEDDRGDGCEQMAKVLIIGGGAAGLESALRLADKGHEIVLLEKNDALGGKAAIYCCKASEECRRCGACLVSERVYQVKKHDLIQTVLSSRIVSIEESGGVFRVRAEHPGGQEEYEVAGMIAAMGFDTIDPRVRGEFGYGRYKPVITARDLEKMLSETGDWEKCLGSLPRIAFIQCFGSREASRGVPYCSRVCCLYTEKLAHILMDRISGAAVDVFYMDRQKYDPVYGAGIDGGIRYVRGMPSRVEYGPGESAALLYEDVKLSAVKKEYYDWIVLCHAVIPGKDTRETAELLGLDFDRYGFVMTVEGNVTNRGGILAAGSCTGPQTIVESIGSGQTAALRMLTHLASA